MRKINKKNDRDRRSEGERLKERLKNKIMRESKKKKEERNTDIKRLWKIEGEKEEEREKERKEKGIMRRKKINGKIVISSKEGAIKRFGRSRKFVF